MRGDPLDGAHAKFRRAELHRKTVLRKIGRYEHRMGLRAKLYPEPGSDLVRVTVEVVGVRDRLPRSWSLDIGSAIQHYRTALEFLAWEAVGVSHAGWRDTGGHDRDVHFPIVECSKDIGSHMATLGHVSANHRAVFERYQPYERRKSALLWLRALSNDDKHKLLIPVSVGPAIRESYDSIIGRKSLAWPVTELERSWSDWINVGALKPDAVIFETKMQVIGPEPEVYVKGSYTGQVALEAIGMGAVEVLEMISAEVAEILEESALFF